MIVQVVLILLFFAENLLSTVSGEVEVKGLASLEYIFETYFVTPLAKVLFFDVEMFSDDITLPFILVWLISGAIFLTIKMRFISIRAFRHAVEVVRGKYDGTHSPGEISHFQALASAVSATVGLGNIAGVAIAVGIGGPGAIVWLIVAGFLGMTSKFVECTLAVKYRHIDSEGKVLGGPMRYLLVGLKEKGHTKLGKVLAVWFSVLCVGGSLGGGNMFQANQAYSALSNSFPVLKGNAWIFGVVLALSVGVVIIGGIKRIGHAAGIIVPTMCLLYLISCFWIIGSNIELLPNAIAIIWNGAFSPEAGYGGFIGVLVTGFRRAAFSNEAGIGSAAIAHSAASTKEPVREGVVALLEPFIDTVVICTITGLTMVITGAYKNAAGDGVLVAAKVFSGIGTFMPHILSVAVLLFAYSTMISWSYYGERCWAFLFKTKNTMPYKVIFVFFTFLGSVFALGPVLEFSDLMILGMAFPNMLGIVLLSSTVKSDLAKYWTVYKSGEMKKLVDRSKSPVAESCLSKEEA